jgi:hypothetical protein
MVGTSGLAIAIGLRGRRIGISRLRWLGPIAAAAVCAIVAALGASRLVGQPPFWVALVVTAGGVGAVMLTRIGAHGPQRLTGLQLVLASGVASIALLVVPLIVWLHRGDMQAHAKIAAYLLPFIIALPATFVARSFKILAEHEKNEASKWSAEGCLVRRAEATWFRVVGLFGTFIVNGLLAFAAVLEGLKQPALCTSPSTTANQWLLPAAAIGAATLCLLARYVRRRRASQPFNRTTAFCVAVLLLGASAAWGAVPYIVARPKHIELFAGLVAAGALWLFIHSLLYHAAREELEDPTRLSRVAATAIGLGCASVMFWLFSSGLWSGNHPVAPPDAARISLTVFIATAGIILITLSAIQQRPSAIRRTLYPALQNIGGDLMGQLLLATALVIVVGTVGQVSAGCHGESGLVLILSVVAVASIALKLGKEIWKWLKRDFPEKTTYLLPTFDTVAQRTEQHWRLRSHLLLQAGWLLAFILITAGWFAVTLASAVRLI